MKSANLKAALSGLAIAGFVWIVAANKENVAETNASEANSSLAVEKSDNVEVTGLVNVAESAPPQLAEQASINTICATNLDISLGNKGWALATEELLVQSLRGLQSKGLSEPVLDLIAVGVGIGLSNGRAMRDGYRPSPKQPRYYEDEVIFSDDKAIKAVELSVSSNSSSPIVDALKNGQIKSNTIFAGNRRMMLLMEFLLEEGLNDETIYQDLLDAGYEPHYTDLVAATQAKLSASIVQSMHVASGLSAEQVLSWFTTQRSLVNYAVSVGSIELVEYWRQAGSPFEPEVLGYNALDLIAKYNANYNDSQFNELSTFLLNEGIRPNMPQTKQLLLSRLNSDIFEKYAVQLQHNPSRGFSQDEQRLALAHITEIHNESLIRLPLKNQITPDAPCHYNWGVQAIQLAQKLGRRKVNSATAVANKDNAKKEDVKQVKALPLEGETKEETEARLAKGQSIQAKHLIQEFRYQQVKELATEIRKNLPQTNEEEEKYAATVNEIMELAQNGHWDQAIAIAHASTALDKTLLFSTLLSIAIAEQADWRIVQQIHENGGQLTDNTISILIISDNADLAQKLLDWGLKLQYKDPVGFDSVTNAVKLKSAKMFEFLLDNGVYPDNAEMGLDALDFAIKDLEMNVWKGFFIEGLLRVGTKVENSHYQWVEQKRDTDMDAYLYLLHQFPQLSPPG